MKSFKSLLATLLLILVFAACGNGASNKDGTENPDTPATAGNAGNAGQQDLEANKKLVTDFIQSLYGDKDSTAIDKYLSDNIIQHNPLLQDGKPWLKNTLRPYIQNPNVQKGKIDIRQVAAEGDKVWTLVREVAPNGKAFARAEIFRIENGKIAEHWLISQPEVKTSANKNGMF